MNVNSFLTCPSCFRMHDARVEVCLTCGFSHVHVESIALETDLGELDHDLSDHEDDLVVQSPDPTRG